MFTPKQYRSKALEYSELLKTTTALHEMREYRQLEHSFATLADNAQWLVDNRRKTVYAPGSCGIADTTVAAEEEYVLQCAERP